MLSQYTRSGNRFLLNRVQSSELEKPIHEALQRSLISSSQDLRDHREGLGLIQPAARVLHTLQH